MPEIDEGARGSVIAEMTRVVAADTVASCTGADSNASVATISAGSLVVAADSLDAAADEIS